MLSPRASTGEELAHLRRHLVEIDGDIRCFLLTLPAEENLRRIERRAAARAIDELEFERQTCMLEREALTARPGADLGEHFAVLASPAELVEMMLQRLGLR